jgi:hypothetical protein
MAQVIINTISKEKVLSSLRQELRVLLEELHVLRKGRRDKESCEDETKLAEG